MKCVNCGTELSEDLSFCTNCGTPLAVSDAAQVTGQGDLGASLASAVEANQNVMSEIESHKDIADEAAARWAEVEAAASVKPEAPIGYRSATAGGAAASAPFYQQDVSPNAHYSSQRTYEADPYGQPEAPAGYHSATAGAATAGAAAAGAAAAGAAAAGAAAAGAPFYQQDVSPNAHYSSQRTYEANPYGQNTGAPAQPPFQQAEYQQPFQQAEYQQPSYSSQPAEQPQQEVWPPQPISHRAYAMVLYVAGLIGLIVGLCVRDKDDAFLTHHLNNVAVITIGVVIASILSAVFIGVILGIYLIVMAVMGMISAYNGDMKELPLIGKIKIIK